MNTKDIITIDGPAGSGKSTLSRDLAKILGWSCLDTGSLYRAVAVAAIDLGLAENDVQATGEMASKLDLKIRGDVRASRLYIGEEEVTNRLRTPEVTARASVLSAWPEVRQALLNIQRRLGESGLLVAEGRDMGTVVFPEAKYKFFLKADAETRARRRYLEMIQVGFNVGFETVLTELKARDQADESRQSAPLRSPEGAVVIDTSALNQAGVLELMLKEVKDIPTLS